MALNDSKLCCREHKCRLMMMIRVMCIARD